MFRAAAPAAPPAPTTLCIPSGNAPPTDSVSQIDFRPSTNPSDLTYHHPMSFYHPLIISFPFNKHLCSMHSSWFRLLYVPPSFLPPSISPSISDLFANQTPSVLPSPTCQEQLPATLLTTLLTTLPHLPRPAARRLCRGPLSPTRATSSFTGGGEHNRHMCAVCAACYGK